MTPKTLEACERAAELVDEGSKIKDACAAAGVSYHLYREFLKAEEEDPKPQQKWFAHGNWTGDRPPPPREELVIPVRRNWLGL